VHSSADCYYQRLSVSNAALIQADYAVTRMDITYTGTCQCHVSTQLVLAFDRESRHNGWKEHTPFTTWLERKHAARLKVLVTITPGFAAVTSITAELFALHIGHLIVQSVVDAYAELLAVLAAAVLVSFNTHL
jgi:hypothetical protein